MSRRGFTFVELIVVSCLTAVIVGTMTLLYGFTFRNIAESATTFAITDQTRIALQTVAATAGQAITCQTVSQNGQTALKCLMPVVGTDLNGDGYNEAYLPSAVSPWGVERYAPGDRIWFYLSDGTGAFGAAGKTLWRAKRADDGPPLASDADKSWTFYGGNGPPRHPLINALSFAIDDTAHTATITITASSLVNVERQPGADYTADMSATTSLTRTVEWRNWRP